MSSHVPVIVAGARGRMGTLACQVIAEDPRFELAGALTRGDDPEQHLADRQGAVLLDLSLHPASVEIVHAAVDAGVHPVIGVSGWTPTELDELTQRCAQARLGALWVPNFSVGAVLQMHVAELAARWFERAHVEETHAPTKRDSPSGTAKETAARMAAARADGAAPPITSRREEGAVAEQRVELSGAHESLRVEHVVNDRRAFAAGMLLACGAVRSLDRLERGLERLLLAR